MKQINTWHGKKCLITGGSSGIGLALAEILSAQGANCWLLARRQEQLEKAQTLILERTGKTCGVSPVDVSNPDEVIEVVNKVTKDAGLPDLVVNSAGLTYPGYVQDLELNIFRTLMDVNYFGTVYVTQTVLPGMIERGSGYIVNISSVAGLLGVFGYSAYGATKYAVRGYTDTLRAEIKHTGVKVSIVFPPDTDTPQLTFEEPLKPPEIKAMNTTAVLSAEIVAQEIVRGIERNRYLIFPGFDSKAIYWGSNLLGPGLYYVMDKIIARTKKEIAKRSQTPAQNKGSK